MEERHGSCDLMAERMIASISCPLFTRQFMQQSDWVRLPPALAPVVASWPHLVLWGVMLQPTLESEDLVISSDVDVWNPQGFSEVT